jgi:curved DNA-binding protein CbpA
MREFNRDDIARAYNTLDLPLGTSFIEVVARYRKVAPGFHPDRFFDPAEKKKAEEKLKKINHAKDILHDHFKGPRASHKEGDSCACRPVKSIKEQKSAEDAAKKAAEEAAKKAAEAAAKKAAEEALKRAAQEYAAQDAAKKAFEDALNAALKKSEQEAAQRAATAKESAESSQSDLQHEQRRLSERERWFAAKACAATFLGIMAFASVVDCIKAGQTSKAQISKLTSAPPIVAPQESPEDEKRFEQEERDRLAYDAQHQYDADVNQCLQQVSENQKLVQSIQDEIDRLRQGPADEESARSIRALQSSMNDAILFWQSASDRLKQLVREHPQIACDRIKNTPDAPHKQTI